MYSAAEKRKDKRLDVDRYEFLVYRLLRNALEAGNVYVRDSNDFRSFEDDLISAERWKDKEAVLREIGAPILLAPIQETLAAFRKELEAKFKRVHERIENGDNKHIKVTGTGDNRRWSLVYPTQEEPINSPFYGQLPGIGIADLLWFVAEKTDFLSAFTHVLERYVKQEADPRLILACIVALGTNMGLWKMAEVSGLSYSSLLTTARNFLRAETLHAGNDGISVDYLIKPARKTFDALIVKEWPNIQRILASLAQKEVTQATIVRKLSSYSRQNQTKKALWELDNIRRTNHILDFIDDPVLRQSIQKALNRGEAYHRMRRAISYVNSGKFRVKTEAEQQIWNECSRLIANAIIYYNTLLLSRVYDQKLAAGDEEAIKILRNTSPVAWRNVNLFGNFDFTAGTSSVDIEAMAARYNNPDFWRRSMQEEGDDGPE